MLHNTGIQQRYSTAGAQYLCQEMASFSIAVTNARDESKQRGVYHSSDKAHEIFSNDRISWDFLQVPLLKSRGFLSKVKETFTE